VEAIGAASHGAIDLYLTSIATQTLARLKTSPILAATLGTGLANVVVFSQPARVSISVTERG